MDERIGAETSDAYDSMKNDADVIEKAVDEEVT